MLDHTSSTNPSVASIRTGASIYAEEVRALHSRCGIYTKPAVVRRILDAIGWRADADLSKSSLLEPAAGDGAFVVEAARRLVSSCIRRGMPLTAPILKNRITAYELHQGETRRARIRVTKALSELGVSRRTAEACAREWIITGDFLLAKLPSAGFTHTAGNPPYIRWSKIPSNLKAKYSERLPRQMIGGDLFLPFLDKALDALQQGGRCGFLCSDRWRFMAFAEGFRKKWLPSLEIASENALSAVDAFMKTVDSYPTILVAKKKRDIERPASRSSGRHCKTLEELGYEIKVGPALGHTPAFVLEPHEHDVEPELLRPWIDGSEISEGQIVWRGRHVIVMYDQSGKLLDLERFPLLKARLERCSEKLEQRSIVKNGAPWFRTIDRVSAAAWMRPKLLVPELAKIPRLAIDRSGAIPSHGVYAIFAPEDKIEALYEILCHGKLARALKDIAPTVKGHYVRCYKRFLARINLH